MLSRRLLGPGLAALALTLLSVTGLTPSTQAESNIPQSMRIGMVGSLFTDVPKGLINVIIAPSFASLMKEFSGMDGQMAPGGDYAQVAADLMEGKTQLAVMHGIEFGWAQQKHPELRPLMIAVNKYPTLQAHIVVAKDDAPTSIDALKGEEIALAKRSKEHCRLFIDKLGLNTKVVRPANIEQALDDVCSGNIKSAVVDNVSLEFYRDIKPGCFNRLKVISQSDIFPAAVIAYRQGGLDEIRLGKFRDGMIAANRSAKGRDLMGMFKISSFEPVPADYAQVMSQILKAYPAPTRQGGGE